MLTIMPITYQVDSVANPTLQQLQSFIDECLGLGMPGTTQTEIVSDHKGWHFTSAYAQATPESRPQPTRILARFKMKLDGNKSQTATG
jgi:hypothetical protein